MTERQIDDHRHYSFVMAKECRMDSLGIREGLKCIDYDCNLWRLIALATELSQEMEPFPVSGY